MDLSHAFREASLSELRTLLDGGVLKIYSVARPVSVDAPITRSGLLATFTFASPAFREGEGGTPIAVFVENPVRAVGVGTPGFARACKADGTTVVADFSVGPGNGEIKLSQVATTPGYPILLIGFTLGELAGETLSRVC